MQTSHSNTTGLVNADKNGVNVTPTKLALTLQKRSKKRLSADTCVRTNDHFSSRNASLRRNCRHYINDHFAGTKPAEKQEKVKKHG